MSTKSLALIFLAIILTGIGYIGWKNGYFEPEPDWIKARGMVINSSVKPGSGKLATIMTEYFYEAEDSMYFEMADLNLERESPDPGIQIEIEYNSNHPEKSRFLRKIAPKHDYMRRYYGFKGDTTFAISLINDIAYYEELYLGEPITYDYFFYDVSEGNLELYELFTDVEKSVSFYQFGNVNTTAELGDTIYHSLVNVKMAVFEDY